MGEEKDSKRENFEKIKNAKLSEHKNAENAKIFESWKEIILNDKENGGAVHTMVLDLICEFDNITLVTEKDGCQDGSYFSCKETTFKSEKEISNYFKKINENGDKIFLFNIFSKTYFDSYGVESRNFFVILDSEN